MKILKDIEAIVGPKGILAGQDVSNRKAGIWIDEGIKANSYNQAKKHRRIIQGSRDLQ